MDENIRKAHEKAMEFFASEAYMPPSRTNLEYMKRLSSFRDAARLSFIETVLLMMDGQTPILDNADLTEFIIDGHAQTKSNELKLLAGQSGGTLTEDKKNPGDTTGVERARQFFHPDYVPQIILSSDLPRALHHTIAKYFPEGLEDKELRRLIEATPFSIEQNYGVIEPKTQLGWLDYSLRLGIIPVPSFRAQNYCPMEFFAENTIEDARKKIGKQGKERNEPQKDTDMKIEAMIESINRINDASEKIERSRLRGLKYSSPDIDEYISMIRGGLEIRKTSDSPLRYKGISLTETKSDLQNRLMDIIETFAPGGEIHEVIKGIRIAIDSHSGPNDNIVSYFSEKFKNPTSVVMKRRAKPDSRGESMLIITDTPKKSLKAFRYLNDPAPLEDAIENTRKTLASFMSNSPDELVKRGEGIMPSAFYGLRKEQGDRETKTGYGIQDILENQDPALIIGPCGIGKTVFTIDLTRSLIPGAKQGETGYSAQDYVPILVKLRDLRAEEERLSLQDPKKEKYDLLLRVASGELSDVDKDTLKTYQKQGKRIVFILDGYDEIDFSLKDSRNISSLVSDLSGMGKVIMTSRAEQFDKYEDSNRQWGFRTYHMDPEAIVKNLDKYLEQRLVRKNEVEKFSEYLKKQSPDIRDNWLMVYFITDIQNREPEALNNLSSDTTPAEVMQRGLEWFVWDHAYRRDPQVYIDPIRIKDESDGDYRERVYEKMKECKRRQIGEIMPVLESIATYMTVKNLQSITLDEVTMHINHEWSLETEVQDRIKMLERK